MNGRYRIVVAVVAGVALAIAITLTLGPLKPKRGQGWTSLGTPGSGHLELAGPAGIFVNAARQIFVADARNARLVRVDDMTGRGWTAFGTRGTGIGQFSFPFGIFVTPAGQIFVSDIHRIVRVDDMTGRGWTTLGTAGKGALQFSGAAGIAVNSAGQIFAADVGNHRIVRIDDMTGTGWTTFGSHGRGLNEFDRPTGLVVGPGGQIFVADTGNHRVVRIDDMSGTGWTTFDTDRFPKVVWWSPSGIFVDASGHLFMTDLANNRIARVDSAGGTGWTTFGTGTGGYDNPLSRWGSIFVTADGELFLADYGSSHIMRAASPPPPAEPPPGGRPRVTTPRAPGPGPQRATPLGEVDPIAGQDDAKGNHHGRLGDFLVGRDQPMRFPPCPHPPRQTQDYKTSELYSPVFGDVEVYACANGRINLIGLNPMGPGKRYFLGTPSVPYEAPLDRLILLRVAGRPGIAQLAAPPFWETVRLTVIERFPSGNRPGIMVYADNARSVEEAAALVARILEGRP